MVTELGMVILLTITIVGIPFAIRRFIRWSLFAQACMLDDLPANAKNVKIFKGLTHGKLMTDEQFLNYLFHELAAQPLADPDTRSATNQTL